MKYNEVSFINIKRLAAQDTPITQFNTHIFLAEAKGSHYVIMSTHIYTYIIATYRNINIINKGYQSAWVISQWLCIPNKCKYQVQSAWYHQWPCIPVLQLASPVPVSMDPTPVALYTVALGTQAT